MENEQLFEFVKCPSCKLGIDILPKLKMAKRDARLDMLTIFGKFLKEKMTESYGKIKMGDNTHIKWEECLVLTLDDINELENRLKKVTTK